MFLRKHFLLAAALCLILPNIAAQAETAPRLTFEVATIKPSDPDAKIFTIKPLPGGTGYTAQNAPLKLMISLMYKIPMRQITGGSDWINTTRFDIEARADHAYSIDDLHTMFQNLLADRFNLTFHKETKDGPVYALHLGPAGLKMKPDGAGQAMGIPIIPSAGGVFTGTRVPMTYLTWWLGQELQNDGRPVINQTGLDQSYDFNLTFAPELPPNMTRDQLPEDMQNLPTIFEAVKQQLGLTLEPAKGPIDYFVIDHVDKPSAN